MGKDRRNFRVGLGNGDRKTFRFLSSNTTKLDVVKTKQGTIFYLV